MDWSITIASINYCIREKYHGTAMLKINEYLGEQPNTEKSDELSLIRCYCLIKLGINIYFILLTLIQKKIR